MSLAALAALAALSAAAKADAIGGPGGGQRSLMTPGGDVLICRHTGEGLATLSRRSPEGQLRWSHRLQAAEPGAEISCERVILHPDGSAWFAGAFWGEVDFGEAVMGGGGRFALGFDDGGGFVGATWRVGPDEQTLIDLLPGAGQPQKRK